MFTFDLQFWLDHLGGNISSGLAPLRRFRNHREIEDPFWLRSRDVTGWWFQSTNLEKHMSNEKNLGWLGCIRDDKLPSYIGIIINHCKDPY